MVFYYILAAVVGWWLWRRWRRHSVTPRSLDTVNTLQRCATCSVLLTPETNGCDRRDCPFTD